MPKKVLAIIATASLPALAACNQADGSANAAPGEAMLQYSANCITEKDIVDAQVAWGEGIIKIGEIYSAGGDYREAAAKHIDDFYAYDLSLVLFKPTLASVEQFRASFDGALSYFVGGNPSFPEDKGFAITPWTKVRWQNAGIINNSCYMAIAMGNYYFTPAKGGAETKVEYNFGYVKDAEGKVRIVSHHSSLPFNGS